MALRGTCAECLRLAAARTGTRLVPAAGPADREAGLIGYHDAVARLKDGAGRLGTEIVAAAGAVGRVLADDVASRVALPPFDNAALDGVALVAGGRTAPAESVWAVRGRIGAGDAAPQDDATAWEIMTGAPLPARADVVVPVEKIAADGAHVRLLADVPSGANIRRRGEDVAIGQVVLRQGALIQPPQMLLLAGLGIERIPVARRPRVALLATGREIVAAGEQLPAGGIHDATSPYLAQVLMAAGAEVAHIVRVGDDVAVFQAALDAALADGADLVLSTGAVSKGCYDFVPAGLQARGADVRFHGVAMRPGKPVLAARLREGPTFVGLPGNPLSTAVGMRFLVEPLLRAWLGLPDETPRLLPLAADCDKRAGLMAAFHGTVRCDAEGHLRAHVGEAQASFRVLPFSQSSVWITLPADAARVEAGTRVHVHAHGHLQPLPWDSA